MNLGNIAGFIAGNPVGAYQDTRKKQQGLDQGDVDAQAQAAAGNAYMGMFGQQQTPGAPPGMPGQPQQGGAPPQQHGLGGLLQGLLAKLQGAGGGGMQSQPPQTQMPPPGPGGGPSGPGGSPPGPRPSFAGAGSAMVPGARPMQPPMAGPQMAGPQMAGPQMGGPQMGGGQPPPGPGMGQQPPANATMPGQPPQGGQLTWQSVVQSVVKSNPGVKDPRVIAAAVDRFLPLMSQQTQQQWKEMSMMLRQQQLDISEQRARTSQDQGQQRINQGEERIDVSRGESARKGEQGDRRLGQGDRRLDQGDRREERLDRAQMLKIDQQHSMLEMQERRLQSQIAANKDRTMLGQWRAIVNAQHARAQEIISSAAAGMDPKERQRLLAEEDKAYTEKIKEMKAIMDGSDKPGGSMVGKGDEQIMGGDGPVKVKTPEDAAKLKPGTKYVTPDGTEYTR